MSLLGSRLTTARYAAALSEIQNLFPINSSLLSAEKTALASWQDKLAQAVTKNEGQDIVTEITTNAVVPSTTSTPGGQAGPTTLPGTATGTVT